MECPCCDTALVVLPGHAGKKTRCPSCDEVLELPDEEELEESRESERLPEYAPTRTMVPSYSPTRTLVPEYAGAGVGARTMKPSYPVTHEDVKRHVSHRGTRTATPGYALKHEDVKRHVAARTIPPEYGLKVPDSMKRTMPPEYFDAA